MHVSGAPSAITRVEDDREDEGRSAAPSFGKETVIVDLCQSEESVRPSGRG
jgi:hypothetical protein